MLVEHRVIDVWMREKNCDLIVHCFESVDKLRKYYKKITTFLKKVFQNGLGFIILVVMSTYILWVRFDLGHKI